MQERSARPGGACSAQRRAGELRGRVVAISLVGFALLWGVVFVQMATGNDPVLGQPWPPLGAEKRPRSRTATPRRERRRAPSGRSRGNDRSRRTEAGRSAEPEAERVEAEFVEPEPVEPEFVEPEPEPDPVITGQS